MDISNDNIAYALANYSKFDVIYKYGEIGNWNTALVTDMNSLFYGNSTFNEDLSGWDVGNVTDMEDMFWNAQSFNGDISKWNVGCY